MRFIIVAPLVALAAACGGEAENKSNASATAAAIAPGLYQVTSEVREFRSTDEGSPKINTPVGTRTTRSVCVPAGGAVQPDLFAEDGMSCQVGSSDYVRSGTINLTLRCTREGTPGNVNYAISGTFDDQSFQGDREMTTLFNGDGDVAVYTQVRGQRTGDCTPGAAGGNSAAPAPGNSQ